MDYGDYPDPGPTKNELGWIQLVERLKGEKIQLQADLAAAREEARDLLWYFRAALRKYGRHEDDCANGVVIGWEHQRCDCGLNTALATGEGKDSQGKDSQTGEQGDKP